MTNKPLPQRASSRTQFVFWQCVAFMFSFFGASMLASGNGVGLVLLAGGFGMCFREMKLRREFKRRQREGVNT